jgi:hypothetical protein
VNTFKLRLNGVNEGEERANTGVNTGVVGVRTSVTPRNNTDKCPSAVDNGATTVTLARVPSTLASAEHAVGDSTGTVGGAAGSAGNNRDVDLQQVGGRSAAARGGSTPASDGSSGAGGGVRAGGWEGNVADGAAGRNRSAELPDGDVVVLSRRPVAGVDGHGRDADEGAAGGTALYNVLVPIIEVNDSPEAIGSAEN